MVRPARIHWRRDSDDESLNWFGVFTAYRTEVSKYRLASRCRYCACEGFSNTTCEAIRNPSFEVNFEISRSRRKAWARRSLLNSAERGGQRAENNRERQRSKADLDFQGSSGGTAHDEPDHAREDHARPASGLGKIDVVCSAPGERRQVDSQLRDVRRHYRGRVHALKGNLYQDISGLPWRRPQTCPRGR